MDQYNVLKCPKCFHCAEHKCPRTSVFYDKWCEDHIEKCCQPYCPERLPQIHEFCTSDCEYEADKVGGANSQDAYDRKREFLDHVCGFSEVKVEREEKMFVTEKFWNLEAGGDSFFKLEFNDKICFYSWAYRPVYLKMGDKTHSIKALYAPEDSSDDDYY